MPSGDYPENWPEISAAIRDRAGSRCECTGQCGLHRGNRCEERNGEDAKWASGKVILTVAHLNHYPPDCRPENLLALCNTCHLRYDQVLHSHHARLKRRQGKAAGDMFGHVERYDGKALKQQRKKGCAT